MRKKTKSISTTDKIRAERCNWFSTRISVHRTWKKKLISIISSFAIHALYKHCIEQCNIVFNLILSCVYKMPLAAMSFAVFYYQSKDIRFVTQGMHGRHNRKVWGSNVSWLIVGHNTFVYILVSGLLFFFADEKSFLALLQGIGGFWLLSNKTNDEWSSK